MVQNEVMEPQNIPLPHSAAIVVVGESANHPKTTVAGVVDGNGGVRYTIEHGGFHCGIVNHILKNYVVAHMEGLVEGPRADVVAREAGVATHAIGWQSLDRVVVSSADGGFIGHLETVWHVACKGDIEHGCLYASVFHNILNSGEEETRLPSKGRAWFQDYAKVRMASAEGLDGVNEQLAVVALTGHEVTATHVYPLYFLEPMTEAGLKGIEKANKIVGPALTKGMKMKTLDDGWELVGQL